MKTKNNLITGILLGIGVIVIPLILMGSTNYTNEKQNKFEIYVQPSVSGGGSTTPLRGFLLNTETGETWYLKNHLITKQVVDVK